MATGDRYNKMGCDDSPPPNTRGGATTLLLSNSEFVICPKLSMAAILQYISDSVWTSVVRVILVLVYNCVDEVC